ncbi:MAG TPA: hypothetical protein VF335_06725 [Chitinivibrionales bacterium]
MSNPTIQRHLTGIRDGFKKVDALTRELGLQPDQAQLDAVLMRREAIVSVEIDKKAKELTAAYPDWQAKARTDGKLRGLMAEAETFMRSIMHMDELLSSVLRSRMDAVQGKMGSMYQTSRVAYLYTTQSTLSARRRGQAG